MLKFNCAAHLQCKPQPRGQREQMSARQTEQTAIHLPKFWGEAPKVYQKSKLTKKLAPATASTWNPHRTANIGGHVIHYVRTQGSRKVVHKSVLDHPQLRNASPQIRVAAAQLQAIEAQRKYSNILQKQVSELKGHTAGSTEVNP